MPKTIYLVPTPIGNLEDMTFRAISVLKKVNLIAAEDTRQTRKILHHFDIKTKLTSYHEHNEITKTNEIFETLKTGDVALVSDAGTPCISDPGYKLVKAAIARDVAIVPLPGATAFVPALIASGLPSDSFVFVGFLPKKSGPRVSALKQVEHTRQTMIFYESPYRLVESLEDMLQVFGDRNISIARELTKKFESFYRMKISDCIEYFKDTPLPGEMVIVVEGKPEAEVDWDQTRVIEALKQEITDGSGLSQAAKNVAALSGWKKKTVYELGLQMQKDS